MTKNRKPMSLDEYIEADKYDSTIFWRLESGEHQNLLESAVDKISELRAELEAVKAERDEANALIEEMQKGEPVAWRYGTYDPESDLIRYDNLTGAREEAFMRDKYAEPLYLALTLPEGWKAVPKRLYPSQIARIKSETLYSVKDAERLYELLFESAPELPK